MGIKMKSRRKTRKLSIQRKILYSVVLLGFISCCFMGITVYSMVSADMLDSSRENTRNIAATTSKIIDGGQHDTLRPGDEDTEIYQKYLQALRQCKEETGILYIYTLKPLDAGNMQFIVDSDETENQGKIGDSYETTDMMLEAMEGNTVVSEEPTNDEFGQYFSAFSPIYNQAGDVTAIIGVDLELSVIEGNLASLRNTIIIFAGISFLMSIGVGLLISRSIGRNLKVVNQKIDDVVYSDGDLTQLIQMNSGDELELMANSLNGFLEQIRSVVGKIITSADAIDGLQNNIGSHLQSAARKINLSITAMAEITDKMKITAASTATIQDTVTAMNVMVDQISGESAAGSDRAGEISQTAISMKQDAVTSREQAQVLLKEITSELNVRIDQSKAVENIGNLSEEIINIAKRTNILALNAKIESARAGEAGKSFAVVASQVAELAENSSKTAQEIGNVSRSALEAVDGLKTTISRFVSFMETNVLEDYEKLVGTGEEFNKNADEFYHLLDGFKQKTKQLSQAMGDIQTKLDTAAKTIDSNVHSVGDISETITELNRNMSYIEHCSQQNGESVNDLNQAVKHFKI